MLCILSVCREWIVNDMLIKSDVRWHYLQSDVVGCDVCSRKRTHYWLQVHRSISHPVSNANESREMRLEEDVGFHHLHFKVDVALVIIDIRSLRTGGSATPSATSGRMGAEDSALLTLQRRHWITLKEKKQSGTVQFPEKRLRLMPEPTKTEPHPAESSKLVRADRVCIRNWCRKIGFAKGMGEFGSLGESI